MKYERRAGLVTHHLGQHATALPVKTRFPSTIL
jgi:hypothetical protein